MERREFLKLASGAAIAWSFAAEAQQVGSKIPRVGVLNFTSMTDAVKDAFRQGLKDHGYAEGKNILVEWRTAEGQKDRAKTAAEELVKLKVNVIVAMLTPAVQAAKDATKTIPIVMAPAGDPVGTGFVASLARPGGNITGMSSLGAELGGKRIELLRELIPGITHVGLLVNTADPFAKSFIEESQTAATKMGVQLHLGDVRRPEEIDAAYSVMKKAGAGAVIIQGVLTGPAWGAGDLATRHRMPSLASVRQLVDSGGLMFYGSSFSEIHRRAASYVDRILKGAKPADLPVEQPTRYELIINMKTARALGITIPQSILVRADRVIE